jgi:general secretion pathway protein D
MNRLLLLLSVLFIGACADLVPKAPPPSEGHIKPDVEAQGEIPAVVDETPVLPAPQPQPDTEKYTVVVNEVPVKELLFALARDAKMNVDIHPGIDGIVTLNAVDQTLPQILDRVAQQVDLRYEIRDNTIALSPDTPYFRTYKVDFVNMARDTTHTVTVATQIDTAGTTDVAGGGGTGGGGGNNNSTTKVTSTSNQRFWGTLVSNIMAIIGEQPAASVAGAIPLSKSVIANPESGYINVLANQRQHEKVQQFIDDVMGSALRQVLVEVTIAEVTLSDRFSAGIDWSKIARDAGFGLEIAGSGLNAPDIGQFLSLTYRDTETNEGEVNATLSLLKEYGDVQVLSSPKLMVLNNQTAMLRVVDNLVYFTAEVTKEKLDPNTGNTVTPRTVETTPHTVPVGIVMSITPRINENDSVILNVRPTVTDLIRRVQDPNPDLRLLDNEGIPEIRSREMESLLKLQSGQTAILGGLMKDEAAVNTQGVPWLSQIFPIGEVFKHRNNEFTKSELVIFLRPKVISNPSLNADLKDYKQFLNPTPDLDVVSPIQSENR